MKTEYDGMKLLSTVLREDKITKRGDILDFIKNAELIRLDNRNKIDSKHVRFNYGDSNSCLRFDNSNGAIYLSDILVVSGGGKTIEDFYKQINVLDEKIKSIEDEKKVIHTKITFMKLSKSNVYSEKEWKAYEMLQLINQRGLNDFEKAKLISTLIK